MTADLTKMAPVFDLLVQAVFEDGRRVQIGVIRGQRNSLRGVAGIEDVSKTTSDLSALLWGCNLDLPIAESQTEVYAIKVEGWVLGRSSAAVAVELMHDEKVFCRIPIDVQRPDIVAHYPAVSEAEKSGFRATVSTLGLPPEFEMSAVAVLRGKNRIPIGTIKARRRTLRNNFEPKLQPLMVTTLGRTGSTWLMRLLGQHPQILAYRPFEYEPRVVGYWMQVLKSVSEPASYLQTLNTAFSDEYWWLGRESHPSELASPADPEVHQWLGQDNIESLTAFCQNRIESFYERIAALQGQTDATYFAEKYGSEGFFASIRRIIKELYPRSREILLVRDFRDVVCSILDYNAKQRFVTFGRENVRSDEEFIERIRLHALALLHNYESRTWQVHLLRYEDLILHPVETLDALLDYLGLTPTLAMVEGMIERASEETILMRKHRTSSDPARSIGRWRRDLDASLQAACQDAFGDVLRGFGYIA
jgi:hypothetical protein